MRRPGWSRRSLEDAGADVIGRNCGSGISTILPAVVALRGLAGLLAGAASELRTLLPTYLRAPDAALPTIPAAARKPVQ